MRFMMGYAADKVIHTFTPTAIVASRKTFSIQIGIRVLFALLSTILALWVAEAWTGIPFLGKVKTVYVQMFIGVIITLAVTMSFYAARFYRAMLKTMTDAQTAKEMAMKSELKALQAQVNPHFLFNTLNSISSLIPTDPGKADYMIQKLADIFRYVLVASEKETVTLQEEMHFIDSYLEIEKVRFDEKLRIEHRIDPETLMEQLPSLILQPIVENALKHGISKNIDGGTLTLSTVAENGRWRIVIEDDGDENNIKITSDGLGIGLKNVNERIKKTYGEDFGVEVEPALVKGMRVIVTMPRNSK
ncbi:histidine kinase [bacterium]|nr:histidine kinase [bacterium]